VLAGARDDGGVVVGIAGNLAACHEAAEALGGAGIVEA
jgi:hypothetical protein